jgi:hypothetical protein
LKLSRTAGSMIRGPIVNRKPDFKSIYSFSIHSSLNLAQQVDLWG